MKHALKNKCYMRQDPHQTKHVCSGHFWLPEYQPYWNARTHLMNAEEFEKKLFSLEEQNRQRNSPHGDKINVTNKFVNVNVPFGSRVLVQDGKMLLDFAIVF